MTSNQAKIFALDLLRDIDSNWSYDECEQYLDNPEELVDADTKRILDNAIADPEVQIDFLDFLASLSDDDKITLLKSLGNDYSKDELANMLVPVFMCLFIGIWLDKQLGTGWLTLVFLILGIMASIRSMFITLKPLLKGEREKKDEAFKKQLDEQFKDSE